MLKYLDEGNILYVMYWNENIETGHASLIKGVITNPLLLYGRNYLIIICDNKFHKYAIVFAKSIGIGRSYNEKVLCSINCK